ncbi:hypothetical protein LJ739_01175 [Aestuariibacter halophilus]|uniref:Transposase n=1 Tax=Fluctibacter halophilus TaxID=226011 RepID=A0ABS8G2U1_9ALTE|nr:hypothetical protein [Aestuariibacter halophilus]MCC2614848.1 hypothetical protein [Aestuariibacter halophilus]
MKRMKLSYSDAAELPECDHARHRRRAYYHGKYNRELTMLTVACLLYLVCSSLT